jgi:hypothetical protein
MRLRTAVVGLSPGGACAGAGPASAAELLRTDVTVPGAADRSCTERQPAGGDGYAQRTVVMPAAGAVAARLMAAEGDWDLAVFEADTGQVVPGSAYEGGARSEETWTLSCEQPEGTVRSARQVFVERGRRRSLDLRHDCRIRR